MKKNSCLLPRIICGSICVFFTSMVLANKPEDITPSEMKLIPVYCPDTMGFNYGDAYTNTSPRAGHWVSLMGKGFWAMHHYCWAQINLLRAKRSGVTSQFRWGTFENIRADYKFVLKNTSDDFIMRPEIYTRLGEVELLLNNPNGANSAFSSAREIKPDYWPAYSHWVEYLMWAGKQKEAKQLVKIGLEYSPTAKVLIQQYMMLGGKISDIVPKEKSPEP